MNIIDLIILALLGFCLVSGMYKGFLTSTLATLGFAGAWYGALRTFNYLVEAVRNNNLVMNTLQGIFAGADLFKDKAVANLQIGVASSDQINAAIGGVNIPFINDLLRGNVTAKAFESIGLTTLGEYLSQTLLLSAINIVSFIVMFAVVYFAVLLLVNLLDNVFRFPQLKHVDRILGGIFGLVRGLAIVLLIFAIMPTVTATLTTLNITAIGDMINGSKFASIFMQDSTNIVAKFINEMILLR